MFDGRYVVDDYALILKALFLLVAYVVVLMSQTELEEGGYYQGEFYVLMLCSVLGMVMMASAATSVGIFVALELLSIPAYMLAAWNKRDRKANEAGVKYYLLGVFASAVLLYGMSLLYGATGIDQADRHRPPRSTATNVLLDAGRGRGVHHRRLRLQGVGRAVPPVGARHLRRCADAGDRVLLGGLEGRRFRGLMTLIFVGLPGGRRRLRAVIWVLAASTMTVGNVLALRQTNIVRMLAYSSVSQGGFILMPLAFAGEAGSSGALQGGRRCTCSSTPSSNLGAFAVVIAVSRKTHSGEICSFGGLFSYAPGLAWR